MPAWVRLIIAFTFVVTVTAACGSEDEATPAPITFEAPAQPGIEGSCTVTSDLESWLQSSDSWAREVSTIIDRAPASDLPELYADVERLGRILIIVSDNPAPDCAASAQQRLIDAIGDIAGQFQIFINEGGDDLPATAERARATLDPVWQALAELTTLLESQFQQGNP